MSIRKTNAVIALTPAADHRTNEGYAVKRSSGSAALLTAATDIPLGVITNGQNTDGQDDLALFEGFAGIVDVKLGGAATQDGFGVIMNGGAFQDDPTSGNRVICCRFLESGVTGDLIKAVLFRPLAAS